MPSIFFLTLQNMKVRIQYNEKQPIIKNSPLPMFHQARDKLLRSIRHNQMKKIIEEQRAQLNESHKKQLHDDFMRHFPYVTAESYSLHKSALAYVVWDQQYSYQILCIADIVCWYLIQHDCSDKESIKILKFISQYQEIQVPQSQLMAQMLINIVKNCRNQENFEKMRMDGLLIIANLASSKRNGLLTKKIIEAGFLDIVSDILAQKKVHDDHNYKTFLELASQIMCSILSSHLSLKQAQIVFLCSLITKISQQNEQSIWTLFFSLSQFRRSTQIQKIGHKNDKKLSKILYQNFEKLIIKYRHGQQLQILDFLIYLAHSGVNTKNQKILEIVKESGQGKYGTTTQNPAFQLATIYIQMQWADEFWDCETLWKVFLKSNNDFHKIQAILELLLAFNDEEIVDSLSVHQDKLKIVEMLIQFVEIRQIQSQVCEILIILLNQEEFVSQLQSLGLERVINKIYAEKNGENCEKIEEVMDKLRHALTA